MIRRYILHNFKNHDTTDIPMAPLTILTGVNGAGKSSIIQSMLLLRESAAKMLPEKLYLAGDSFFVGKSTALLNGGVKDRKDLMSIELQCTNDESFFFEFKYPETASSTLNATERSCPLSGEDLSAKLSLFSDNFQYLSANRIGPAENYGIDTNVVNDHRQLSHKMGQGEYTVYFLDKFGNEDIPNPELAYLGTESLALKTQVEAWLSEISKDVRMKIETSGDKLELKFGYRQADRPVLYHSAYNSGYGLSYVLAVVTAILSAPKEALILIENPEAHIHPHGQSALMKIIGKAAKCGVQVLIETHSDHIINGALVSAKAELGRENLSIAYLTKDEEYNAVANILEIEPYGRIVNAPEGFCDQMEIDMDQLFDMGTYEE